MFSVDCGSQIHLDYLNTTLASTKVYKSLCLAVGTIFVAVVSFLFLMACYLKLSFFAITFFKTSVDKYPETNILNTVNHHSGF